MFTQILSNAKSILKIAAFGLAIALVPMGHVYAHQKGVYTTKISFDKNNPFILGLADNKIQMEIGPSRYDVEQRRASGWVVVNDQVRPTESISHDDPTEFRPVYQAAGQQFGIPWQIIEAVHQVETGKSGSTAVRSYAGAQGPMQFMPGTWRGYAIDGNGDGVADITDVTDAIYTGANYLAKSGADEGRIDDAIFNYNHSQSYVNKVKTIAYEIGL